MQGDHADSGKLPDMRPTADPAISAAPARPAAPPHPLDRRWSLHIDGQTYGPYDGHALKGFIAEGRVTPSSHVLREGASDWQLASQDPTLGALFEARRAQPTPPPITAEKRATVVQVTNTIAAPMAYFDDVPGPKSPGIALLLSLLICGIGQMYNGQVAKGFLMLIGSALLWLVLLGWVIWIWSMIDAYQTAKGINLRWSRRLAAGTA